MDFKEAMPVSVWSKTNDGKEQWLGTAFAVSKSAFMTARHVVCYKGSNKQLPDVFIRGDIFKGGHKGKLYISNIHLHDDESLTNAGVYQHDYALLVIESLKDADGIYDGHIFNVIDAEFDFTSKEKAKHIGFVNEDNDISRDDDIAFDYLSSNTQSWVFKDTVRPGESGSPVFTQKGLIGLIKSRVSDAAEIHVVPATRFRHLLEKHVPEYANQLPEPSGFRSSIKLLSDSQRYLKDLMPHIAEDLSIDSDNNPQRLLYKLADFSKHNVLEALDCLYRSTESYVETGSTTLAPKSVAFVKSLGAWCLAIYGEQKIRECQLDEGCLLQPYSEEYTKDIGLLVALFKDTQSSLKIDEQDENSLVPANCESLPVLEPGRDDKDSTKQIEDATKQRLVAIWEQVFGKLPSDDINILERKNIKRLNAQIGFLQRNKRITPYARMQTKGDDSMDAELTDLRNYLETMPIVEMRDQAEKPEVALFDEDINITLWNLLTLLEQGKIEQGQK